MGELWANLRVELPHLPSEPPDDDMDAYVEQHLCATGADVAACGTLKDALSKLRRVWDAIQALNLLNSSMRIPATVIYTQTVEFGEFEHIHSPQQLQDMLKKVKVGVFKTDAERNGVILASVCALFAHVNDARSELDVLKLLKFTDADLDDSAIVYHIYYSLLLQHNRALNDQAFIKPVVALYDGSFLRRLCTCTTAAGAAAAFRGVVVVPKGCVPRRPQLVVAVQRCIVVARNLDSMLLLGILEEFLTILNGTTRPCPVELTCKLLRVTQTVCNEYLKGELQINHARPTRLSNTVSPAVALCARRAISSVLKQARESEKIERRARKQRQRRAAKVLVATVSVVDSDTREGSEEATQEATDEVETEAETAKEVVPPAPSIDSSDTAPDQRECLVCLEELSGTRRALFLCCNTLFVCDACSRSCSDRCPNCRAEKPRILTGLLV